MSTINSKEQRQHPRYDTEVQVYFQLAYDLKTKVKFQLWNNIKNIFSPHKYSGFSKNVSCSGIALFSNHPLKVEDIVKMEVFLPGREMPIITEGQVCWVRKNPHYSEVKKKLGLGRFEMGIKVNMLDGKSVKDTVYYDEVYKVEWSIVLESILGQYRIYLQDKKKNESSGTVVE